MFREIELPNENRFEDEAGRTKQARIDLKSASKMASGSGFNKEMEDGASNLPISLDKVLEERKVELVTPEYIKKVLGKKRVDSEVIDKIVGFINDVVERNDVSIAEHFRDTCIDVLDSLYGVSKISFQEYMNACLFVSYRSSGDTKVKAYAKTFPDRVMRLEREGHDMQRLCSYAEIYSKTKAVIDVQAKVMIPTHLMYHDMFHQAIRVATDIMMDTKVSPKVRIEAANVIMTNTRQPEIKKQAIDINIKESDAISQLRDALHDLSKQQSKDIIDGNYSVVDVIDREIYAEDEEDS